ncbi:hypothetical protein [Lapidilactobacillus luobeiensis]|uniref:hypothetical protein n=1 Tax=Lapidilactobacillus luobeiensis TaxID=2950371 RepID=UPI0021C46291|nr:hypothetical protein [Lapidilactobacillus luobeiensis]
MSQYRYPVSQGDTLNIWKYSDLQAQKVKNNPKEEMTASVNKTEKYLEIEYPVRRHFLQNISNIPFDSSMAFPNLYVGFENPRVDFSMAMGNPYVISTFLNNKFYVQQDCAPQFLLETCGRVCVWVNGQRVIDFHPYTRNHLASKIIDLPLNQGENNVVVYMDDLAERDVTFAFQLTLLDSIDLTIGTEVDYEEERLQTSIDFLKGLYFERDLYTEGQVAICCDSTEYSSVMIEFEHSYFQDNKLGGDIADFNRQNRVLSVIDKKITLGDVSEFDVSGSTDIYIGIEMPNKSYLFKKLVVGIYDKQRFTFDVNKSLPVRKKYVLDVFSHLTLLDMNSALAEFALNGDFSDSAWSKLMPAIQMIKDKRDCADFMFAPLLAFTIKYYDKVPKRFLEQIKQLALRFRYWIDEPGNDVMWYFSENHSLLFHCCQYFAGRLFATDKFSVSKRYGSEQEKIGRERLLDWFAQFNKFGFSEWNSSTYLPIDLIGFFSIYISSKNDEEVYKLAQNALDFTFKIMAINHHGNMLSSTYGRIYEHDLKGMRLGEISSLLQIAWGRGQFNYASRAATLFCLSDYQPPEQLTKYLLSDTSKFAIYANYLQGENRVETYLYKTSRYSLASAVDYNAFNPGHQQHMMNISLGTDGTQLWLNNPGELAHSGENRPSYWAGNSVCPRIYQYKNLSLIKYNLEKTSIKFVHLYVPFWLLNEIVAKDNWLFVRKNESYLGIYFSKGFNIVKNGDTRNREVVSQGSNQDIVVKCSSVDENFTFGQFIDCYSAQSFNGCRFVDKQIGSLEVTKKGLVVNGVEQNRADTYKINPLRVNILEKGEDDEGFKEK